ncbi:peptide-binding protein [Methylocystis sp.]|uniref:peptide-binding protein n=1 Tax=Methylocystis sp. TaxID=1911079 RepID=UPI0025DBB5C0|nr:peptide-binding protein [Methylocystis sp.]
MTQKLAPFAGLTLAALAAAIAWGATALAGDRCVASDVMGVSIVIHDQRKNVIGAIEDGNAIIVQRYGEDDHGKPWAYVTSAGGKRLGWVYREFISCG